MKNINELSYALGADELVSIVDDMAAFNDQLIEFTDAILGKFECVSGWRNILRRSQLS